MASRWLGGGGSRRTGAVNRATPSGEQFLLNSPGFGRTPMAGIRAGFAAALTVAVLARDGCRRPSRQAGEAEPAQGESPRGCDRLGLHGRLDWGRRVARRNLGPLVPFEGTLAPDLEQRSHISRFERLLERRREGLWNVGQIEIDAVALGGEIDPVEVAHPLRLDERRHRALEDAERGALDRRPIRVETRVADDVDAALPVALLCGKLLRGSGQRRRIDENLGAGAPVDVHLLVLLAVDLDIDHDRRERAGDRS